MAPKTTSLASQPRKENGKPPRHQVVKKDGGGRKPISLSPQGKAEKEVVIEEKEANTDSEEDDEVEDEKDGKPIAQLPSGEDEEETDSEDDDDEEEDEINGKSIEPSVSNKAEEETDSDYEEEIQNNGSNSKSNSDASTDSGASLSNCVTKTISKPLNIITEKRSNAEMTDDKQSSCKSNKKAKRDVMEKKAPTPAIAWGNEDAVILLRGMDDFKNKTGLDPKSELGDFYNSIKEKLKVVRSIEQVKTKITYMRKRFINIMNRREDDSDPVFSKPLDCLFFDVSKKIWGDDDNIISNRSSKNSKSDCMKGKEIPTVSDEKSNDEGQSFWSKYSSLSCLFDELSTNFPSMEFSQMKDKMSLIENEVAKEIDDKCKQLYIDHSELKGKMADLVRDVLKRDRCNLFLR